MGSGGVRNKRTAGGRRLRTSRNVVASSADTPQSPDKKLTPEERYARDKQMALLDKILLISVFMRCKMSSGVPAGAKTPIQVLDSKPG